MTTVIILWEGAASGGLPGGDDHGGKSSRTESISGKDTIGQHVSSLPDGKNHFKPKVQIPQVCHLDIQSQQMGLGIESVFISSLAQSYNQAV